MSRESLIQVRRGTAAQWYDANSVLEVGEIGFETDTGKLKVGTASIAWNSLPYVTDASDVSGIFSSGIFSGSSSTDLVRITQTGTGNALVVEDSNPDSTPFVVNASGFVGIGITSPAANLHITGTDTIFSDRSDATVNPSNISLRKSRGSTTSPTVITTGDILGRINFRGYDGSAYTNAAAITGTSEGTIATGIVPGFLSFATNSSAGVSTERMRINSAGEVGIGAVPQTGVRLVVTGGATNDANPEFRIQGASGLMDFHNNLAAGGYNSITTAGSKGIIVTGNNNSTLKGSLVIAPWSDTAYGIRLTGGSTTDILIQGTTTFSSSSPANKALIVQGVALQAGNLFEVQDASATPLFVINYEGSIKTGTIDGGTA